MSELLKKMFVSTVKKAYDDVVNGRCEIDEEQMIRIMSVIAHRPVSKDVACEEVLHYSRSKFDMLVSQGRLPQGRKRRGWKELVWYEDELIEAKDKLK